MILPFSKYHGLGNDFVVLDLRVAAFDDEATSLSLPDFVGPLAVELCDRHRGIGGDGLLLFTGTPAAPVMRVVNADGSVPEMCGNGLRCFVKYVVDRFGLKVDRLVVMTDAGPLPCSVSRAADGSVATVSVAMGTPSYAPQDVPVAATSAVIDHPLTVDGTTVHITGVGTGNPHLVLFDRLSDDDRLRLGPLLSSHPLFPAQANVEFCTVLEEAGASDDAASSEMRCDVFERGCGWTQACGTGATAAATAAIRLGRVPAGHPVRVCLPGGWLTIEVSAEGAATMTGPAAHVFDGTVQVG